MENICKIHSISLQNNICHICESLKNHRKEKLSQQHNCVNIEICRHSGDCIHTYIIEEWDDSGNCPFFERKDLDVM